MAAAGQTLVSVPSVPSAPLKVQVTVRCPQCGRAFARTGHVEQVCPTCGLRGPTTAPGERIMPEGVVGRPQRAWLTLTLSWLVAPVFWPLLLRGTFRPLDRQHGRDHPVGLWVPALVPFLGALLALPYAMVGLARLKRSRRARGLRKGVGQWTFLLVALVTPLAAVGYGLWLHGTHATSTGALDFAAAFDGDRLTAWGTYADTFWGEADWAANALLLVLWGLSPAIALAGARASANSLWRVIYQERGEAWPWRAASADATPVA